MVTEEDDLGQPGQFGQGGEAGSGSVIVLVNEDVVGNAGGLVLQTLVG